MTENDINVDMLAELDKNKRIANGQAYALKLAVEALARVVILEAKNNKLTNGNERLQIMSNCGNE